MSRNVEAGNECRVTGIYGPRFGREEGGSGGAELLLTFYSGFLPFLIGSHLFVLFLFAKY